MQKQVSAVRKLSKEKEVELERKSVEELKELLDKQEKLFQNKKLMKSLPDHGQKIVLFIEKIRKALELRNSVDDVADRLKGMRFGEPSDERKNYANSYEFIIKQNSDVKMKMCPQKFRPTRLTKDKKDKSSKSESCEVKNPPYDMPQNASSNIERMSFIPTDVTTLSSPSKENSQPLITTCTQMNQGNETQRRLKYRYDASLEEMLPYERKHAQGTQLISIQAGMNLMRQHHAALQEAELKRAEAMLATSIDVKLSSDINSWSGDKFNKYRDERGALAVEQNDDGDDDDNVNGNIDIKSDDDHDDDDDDYDGID